VTTPTRARSAPTRGFFRRTFQSFSSRSFRLFFWGQLLSNTGNWLTMVALTLLVLKLTDSGFAVGLLTACQFGPILLLSAWAGVIADRSNKRRLLFVTQSLEMVQSFALGALAFMGHPPLAALFGTALVGGVLLAFDNPIRRSFVAETVEVDDLPNAVTLYSAMVNTSRIFGPALAGALVVSVGYGWCFTIDAFSYLFVLVALWAIRPADLRKVPVTPRGRGQVREGLRYVRRVPALRITFVMLAVIGTLTYNFSVLFPLFVIHGLHGSDATYTAVYSVFSMGALVGALAVARRSSVRIRIIVIGAAGFGASMLVLAGAPSVVAVFPIVFLVGITSISYMTATTAIVQVRSDPQMQGRVIALQTVLLVGTTPIGGPLLGALADAYGARVPMVVGGVAALGAAAWGAMAGRRELSADSPVTTGTAPSPTDLSS
jgi:MFS family permease